MRKLKTTLLLAAVMAVAANAAVAGDTGTEKANGFYVADQQSCFVQANTNYEYLMVGKNGWVLNTKDAAGQLVKADCELTATPEQAEYGVHMVGQCKVGGKMVEASVLIDADKGGVTYMNVANTIPAVSMKSCASL